MEFFSRRVRVTDDDCTDEKVNTQSALCKEKYMKWKYIPSVSEDQPSRSELLEDYYICVDRLNAMRIHSDNKIRSKISLS